MTLAGTFVMPLASLTGRLLLFLVPRRICAVLQAFPGAFRHVGQRHRWRSAHGQAGQRLGRHADHGPVCVYAGCEAADSAACAFASGGVTATSSYANGACQVPASTTNGQVYVYLIQNNGSTITDANTVAGPVRRFERTPI